MDTNRILAELRAERDRIDRAITAIEAINSTGHRRVGRPPRAAEKPRRRGRLSAAARARIAAARRVRWAKVKRVPCVQAGAENERRCPEEDVAAAEAALGARER